MRRRVYFLTWSAIGGLELCFIVASIIWHVYVLAPGIAGILGGTLISFFISRSSWPPRVLRPNHSRVRLLSDLELGIAEAVIEVYAKDEHRVFPSQIAEALGEWWSGRNSNELTPEGQQALANLYRAGLLEDCRNTCRDAWPAFAPGKGAAEILAAEQERRLRMTPLGPRQRLSALST
jgi:hypothetical protein